VEQPTFYRVLGQNENGSHQVEEQGLENLEEILYVKKQQLSQFRNPC
jgi:hypothetical protein